MNRLSTLERAKVIAVLVEGNSLRATARITGVARMTVENVALHFMYYNFCKVHQTLRVTPAMEAGLSDHVWDIEELITLL